MGHQFAPEGTNLRSYRRTGAGLWIFIKKSPRGELWLLSTLHLGRFLRSLCRIVFPLPQSVFSSDVFCPIFKLFCCVLPLLPSKSRIISGIGLLCLLSYASLLPNNSASRNRFYSEIAEQIPDRQ